MAAQLVTDAAGQGPLVLTPNKVVTSRSEINGQSGNVLLGMVGWLLRRPRSLPPVKEVVAHANATMYPWLTLKNASGQMPVFVLSLPILYG